MRRDEEVITGELSPREREVLSMMNSGLSGSTIALNLEVAPTTVATLVYRIKEKARRRGFKKMTVFVNEHGEIWRG